MSYRISFCAGEGRHTVTAVLSFCGSDICLSFGGGDQAHIGACALAVPRASLDAAVTERSASCSLLCVNGHKDDLLARTAALAVAARFNAVAVVTVGLHIDGAAAADIAELSDNFQRCLAQVLELAQPAAELILVDNDDAPVGTADKLSAHRSPMLHRAFSVFIVNSAGQMLLQKRALCKYHSGGLWSNACCSHPRPGEEVLAAAERRLAEECGISGVRLQELFTFVYQHRFDDALYEYEYDHVLLGIYDGEVSLDPAEAAAYKWLPLSDVGRLLAVWPELFTVWFQKACPGVLSGVNWHKKEYSR